VALPNSRFMMLGTPNLGSHEAVRWLTGTNPTEARLSLLDIAHSCDEIVNIEFRRVRRDVKTDIEVELEFRGHPKGGILNHLVT